MGNKTTSEVLKEMLALANQLALSEDDATEKYSEILKLTKDIGRELDTHSYFLVSDLCLNLSSPEFFKRLAGLLTHSEAASYKEHPRLLDAIEKHLTACLPAGDMTFEVGSANIIPGIGITFISNLPILKSRNSSIRWSVNTKRAAIVSPTTLRDKIASQNFNSPDLFINESLPQIMPLVAAGILESRQISPIRNECHYVYMGKSYRCSKLSTIREVNSFIQIMGSDFGEYWGLLHHDEDNGDFYVASVEDIGR